MNQQNNKQYLEKHDELLWITVVIQTSQKGREIILFYVSTYLICFKYKNLTCDIVFQEMWFFDIFLVFFQKGKVIEKS